MCVKYEVAIEQFDSRPTLIVGVLGIDFFSFLIDFRNRSNPMFWTNYRGYPSARLALFSLASGTLNSSIVRFALFPQHY